jgi:N12 class adenine-specific DNA methylase
LRDWVYETPVILRKLSLDSRELANKIEGGEDKIRKPRISDKAIEKVVGPERMKTLKRSERQEIIEKLSEEKIKGQLAELQRLQSVVEGLSNLSERERAVFGQALDKWLAQRQESYLDPDPGIFFEDLGCDALMVDEAQNFKNLWPVAAREGGIPKYLGAISEGSDRAYALAVRSYRILYPPWVC